MLRNILSTILLRKKTISTLLLMIILLGIISYVTFPKEEMPEVDHLYMSVCQAMTGRGGWPLTIVMTPKKKPFFSGTYFPKIQKGPTPGMLQLIPSLKNAWINRQNEIHDSINKVEKFSFC